VATRFKGGHEQPGGVLQRAIVSHIDQLRACRQNGLFPLQTQFDLFKTLAATRSDPPRKNVSGGGHIQHRHNGLQRLRLRDHASRDIGYDHAATL